MKTSIHALALISSSTLGLFACAAPTVSSAPGLRAEVVSLSPHQALLPAPNGPLDLSSSEGNELTLAELLARLSKCTGVTFSTEDSTGDRLKKTAVVITPSKRVPAPEVYPWVESILQQNGYSLGVLKAGDAPLVGVYFNMAARLSNPPMITVEADCIEECRMHPALFVTTVVTLPNTDVRTLANSLRAISSDSPASMAIPVGNTHSVILAGSGQQVFNLVQMLKTIDARTPPPAQGDDPIRP